MSKFSLGSILLLATLGCTSVRVATESDTKSLVDHLCSEMKANRDLGPDAKAFFLGYEPYSSGNPYGHLNYKSELLADLKFKPTDDYRKSIKASAKGSNGETLLHCAVKNNIKWAFERLAQDASNSDLKIKDDEGRDIFYYAKTNTDQFYLKQIANKMPKQSVSKDFFCNGDKAIARMVGFLEAQRSSEISSIPLDKAQAKIKDFNDKSRSLAKNIFEYKVLSLFGQDSPRNYSKDIKFYSEGKSIYPDPDAIGGLTKFSDLVSQYTFMISGKDQKEIFKQNSLTEEMPTLECNDSVNYDTSDARNGLIGLDSSCKFLPSKALSDRRRAWLYIVRKFTAIKESPGRDNNSIRFEVSLDLAPFCAYGISTDDLLSR